MPQDSFRNQDFKNNYATKPLSPVSIQTPREDPQRDPTPLPVDPFLSEFTPQATMPTSNINNNPFSLADLIISPDNSEETTTTGRYSVQQPKKDDFFDFSTSQHVQPMQIRKSVSDVERANAAVFQPSPYATYAP